MASSMEGTSEEKMPLLAEEGKAQESKADADEACPHSKMHHDSWVGHRCIVMYLFDCFWNGARSSSQFAGLDLTSSLVSPRFTSSVKTFNNPKVDSDRVYGILSFDVFAACPSIRRMFMDIHFWCRTP